MHPTIQLSKLIYIGLTLIVSILIRTARTRKNETSKSKWILYFPSFCLSGATLDPGACVIVPVLLIIFRTKFK